MRFLKRFTAATGGASALEFALVAPVFFAMLFGTIQVGLGYYYAGSVQFALERTARITMVDQDMSEGEVQAAFATELAAFTDQDVDVTYTVDSSGDVPIGQFAATYAHEVIIPFVPSFDITFNVVTKVPLTPE
jgi:Flp pilus assembly protein TadG